VTATRPKPPGTLRFLRTIAWAAVRNKLLGRAGSTRRGPKKRTSFDSVNRSFVWNTALLLFMFSFFTFIGVLMASMYLDTVGHNLGTVYSYEFLPRGELWPPEPYQGPMILAIGTLLLLVFVPLIFANLAMAQQDLGRVEWDVEWLFTFPVSTRAIYLGKAFGYMIVNPLAWLVYLPLFIATYWSAGYSWLAIPMALASSAYLVLFLGLLTVAIEVRWRATQPLSRLKNLQALCSLLGMVLTFAAIGLGVFIGTRSVLKETGPLYLILMFVPWCTPILLAKGGAVAIAALAVMVFLAVYLPRKAMGYAEKYTEGGLTNETAPYKGRRTAAAGPARKRGFLRGIVGKDLTLLRRDRNFLVQTLVIPLVVSIPQLFNMGRGLAGNGSDFRYTAMLAYGVASYVVILGGSKALMAEGPALWLIYTFPRKLTDIIFQKALLWCAVGSAYAVAVMVLFGRHKSFRYIDAANVVMVLAGVFIYAILIVGMSSTRGAAARQTSGRPVSAGTGLLGMFLLGAYSFGIYTDDPWQKATHLALFGLVAYAVWQKLADRLPYLLDPADTPRPRVSLADGLTTVFAFFAVQGLFRLVLALGTQMPFGVQVALSYAGSATVVGLASLAAFALRGTEDLALDLGLRGRYDEWVSKGKAVMTGLTWGAAAGAFGLAYLFVAEHIPWLRELKRKAATDLTVMDPLAGIWVAAILVTLVPVFEEYIFRGLVFKGLRRSAGPLAAAAASSAIFALVHPPISVIPVFVLGVAAAVSFERAKLLAAPVAAHAFYNLVVLAGGHFV